MPAILIVENEVILALDLADTLAALGYEVVGPAVTADDACRMARDSHPDIVLMDVRLDGRRDGIAAAEEIMAEQGTKVIFLSSEDDQGTRERAAAIGPFAWLDKPCSASHIQQTLAQALSPDIGSQILSGVDDCGGASLSAIQSVVVRPGSSPT
ncbi:hypothetical protein GCM10007276_12800 [Agaricicola taiwanensis]|uniref:Response regulatory domain-containing protein n=1 Tax=Agaricicola taiwanensis TaxID=591372 RepID=A0A8J2VVF9_9RHOB|nr:response regulator [Agaricicola taiwanensis]GGE36787.1 hypothetical protein GCM10007276_12800 [Agaricicola taiwanensis]